METKLFLIASFFLGAINVSFSQENELPETGNVGIGTTNPTEKLDVRGGANIDSTLSVGDSLLINHSARVGDDLKVNGNAIIEGDLNVNGAFTLPTGPAKLTYLLSTDISEPELLLIDQNGDVQRGGELKSLVYAEASSQLACKDNDDGYTTPAFPTWVNSSGKIFTSRHCVPNVLVGIGLNNPIAKLHIKTNDVQFQNTKAILVENSVGDKVFQVNPNGLVYAREVKVNLDALWPDYVFGPSYDLMPLDQLQCYIDQNGHLPNVPNASQMADEGVDVATTSVMLMEKVEENTLYILQLQQQLIDLQLLLNEQKLLIEAQQKQLLEMQGSSN